MTPSFLDYLHASSSSRAPSHLPYSDYQSLSSLFASLLSKPLSTALRPSPLSRSAFLLDPAVLRRPASGAAAAAVRAVRAAAGGPAPREGAGEDGAGAGGRLAPGEGGGAEVARGVGARLRRGPAVLGEGAGRHPRPVAAQRLARRPHPRHARAVRRHHAARAPGGGRVGGAQGPRRPRALHARPGAEPPPAVPLPPARPLR